MNLYRNGNEKGIHRNLQTAISDNGRFFMLRTACTNHVDYFASAAEISPRENCGEWSQLYFGIPVGWSQLSTGMKPTDPRTGLVKPTVDNPVALTGALETDYACNWWIYAIGTCTHKFSDEPSKQREVSDEKVVEKLWTSCVFPIFFILTHPVILL